MRQYAEKFLTAILKSLIHKDQVSFAKEHLIKTIPFWVAAVLAAVCAIGYAEIIAYAEALSLEIIHSIGGWALLWIPAMFIASWFVVDQFAPYASGSGIPQVMAAADISGKSNNDDRRIISKLLSKHVFIAKLVSSLLAVLGGGAIGREGPTLQMTSSIFKQVEKWFTKHHFVVNLHGMLLAGGAAGIAAAFNTPMGGIAYAIEELSKSHVSNFRTGILHAVIIAGIATQLSSGSYLYLGYPKIEKFGFEQYGNIIAISIVVGLFVTGFSSVMKKLTIFKRNKLSTRSRKAAFAGIAGLIFACFGLFLSPQIFGSGKELLNHMLFESKVASPLDVISRFSGTYLTYASGGAGGIFAPVLALGGACSSLLGALFTVPLGSLTVLIGMVAGLSALTHSPLTAFILIVEMTDRHSAILPLMVASLFASGVSKLVSKNSFYEFVCQQILKDESDDDKSKNSEIS